MTTNASIIYAELSGKMQRSLTDAVSRSDQTVSFEGSHRLDGEAQSLLGIPGSPFAGAVYDPGTSLSRSPACYILSDEVIDFLS